MTPYNPDHRARLHALLRAARTRADVDAALEQANLYGIRMTVHYRLQLGSVALPDFNCVTQIAIHEETLQP